MYVVPPKLWVVSNTLTPPLFITRTLDTALEYADMTNGSERGRYVYAAEYFGDVYDVSNEPKDRRINPYGSL